MRGTILTAVLLSSVLISYAQESRIELIGQILNAETKEPVPFVHVINANQELGTTSNTEGRFWMKMKKTDTLKLSAIGFNSFLFTLKEDITTTKLYVTLELNSSTLELEPVKVFAYRNEQALKQAIINTKVPLEEDSQRIELPGFYYGPPKKPKDLRFGPNGITVTGPFALLQRKFGREAKESKKLLKLNKQNNYQKQIQSKYNKQVVMELTGLKEDQVEDFMEFCALKDSFLGSASEYEIAVAVNGCLTDLNKINVADSLADKLSDH
ncbi:MAG: carboxypeptidase-like regulatory domain-containing protein [Bacteroidota bacterium]